MRLPLFLSEINLIAWTEEFKTSKMSLLRRSFKVSVAADTETMQLIHPFRAGLIP